MRVPAIRAGSQAGASLPVKRLRLVYRIHSDGSYENRWFKVVSAHSTARAARHRAVAYRKAGALARVRRVQGRYLVAVRVPRRTAPAQWMLEV